MISRYKTRSIGPRGFSSMHQSTTKRAIFRGEIGPTRNIRGEREAIGFMLISTLLLFLKLDLHVIRRRMTCEIYRQSHGALSTRKPLRPERPDRPKNAIHNRITSLNRLLDPDYATLRSLPCQFLTWLSTPLRCTTTDSKPVRIRPTTLNQAQSQRNLAGIQMQPFTGCSKVRACLSSAVPKEPGMLISLALRNRKPLARLEA